MSSTALLKSEYKNKFQVNNNYIHLDSYEQVADQKMVFLSDNFECNNIEDSLELECEVIQIKNFKSSNSEICFKIFKSNNFFGFIVFVTIVFGKVI